MILEHSLPIFLSSLTWKSVPGTSFSQTRPHCSQNSPWFMAYRIVEERRSEVSVQLFLGKSLNLPGAQFPCPAGLSWNLGFQMQHSGSSVLNSLSWQVKFIANPSTLFCLPLGFPDLINKGVFSFCREVEPSVKDLSWCAEVWFAQGRAVQRLELCSGPGLIRFGFLHWWLGTFTLAKLEPQSFSFHSWIPSLSLSG